MAINLSNVELFNELSEIAERTRSLLLKAELEGNDIQRIGHCGLCGEFMHSFVFPMMDVKSDQQDDLSQEEIGQNFKARTLEMVQKNSQLSASVKRVSGDLFGNEIVLDAISRSIEDLREWSQKTDHRVNVEISALADRADEVYNPIKKAIKSELKIP